MFKLAQVPSHRVGKPKTWTNGAIARKYRSAWNRTLGCRSAAANRETCRKKTRAGDFNAGWVAAADGGRSLMSNRSRQVDWSHLRHRSPAQPPDAPTLGAWRRRQCSTRSQGRRFTAVPDKRERLLLHFGGVVRRPADVEPGLAAGLVFELDHDPRYAARLFHHKGGSRTFPW
jgi:hypothetical protein